MSERLGIAPGAAAWKWLLAEERDRTDDLVAEVERLTAQLDAAREAWRHEAFTAFHPVSGKSGVVYAVTPETVEAVTDALGGDA